MTALDRDRVPQSSIARPSGGPNGLGIAALVVGILAVVTCWTVVGGVILGLVAIVLGGVARGRAKRGEAGNPGVALAGLLLGIAGLVLSGVLVAFGAATFFSHGGGDLVDCVNKAHGDQAKVQQCQQQFKARNQ